MEWLPQDDIVHLIVEAVAMMDLSKFEAGYKLGGAGKAPFAPQMLLALLIYAYSQGVRSSRAIERLCHRDAGYRFIVGDAIPDHTVIARFRQRHAAEMKEVFLGVLRLCREAGLVKLGLVALDGTKVQGNASLEANRTIGSIEAEIAQILAEAEATDAREDSQTAAQQGATLPKSLAGRADRLARLRKCKEKLERQAAAAAARQQAKIDAREPEEQATGKRKRGRKPKAADPSVDPDTNACVTDPDSGIMKTRRGWLQGYNGQIVVTTGQIIIAADVTTEANDVRQLHPMLAQAQANVVAVADEDEKDDGHARSGGGRCRLLVGGQRGGRDRRLRVDHRHAEGPQAACRSAQCAGATRPQAEEHDGARADGSQAAHEAWAGALSPPRRLGRAGVRADEGLPGRPPLQHARARTLPRRVEPARRRAQYEKATPGVCPACRKGQEAGGRKEQGRPPEAASCPPADVVASLSASLPSAPPVADFATGSWPLCVGIRNPGGANAPAEE